MHFFLLKIPCYILSMLSLVVPVTKNYYQFMTSFTDFIC